MNKIERVGAVAGIVFGLAGLLVGCMALQVDSRNAETASGQLEAQRENNQIAREMLKKSFPELAGAPSGDHPVASAETHAGGSMCTNDGSRPPVGWGPVRPMYSTASPPAYATLASVKDNPLVGDERSFFAVKDAANEQAGGWVKEITPTRGHTYLLRIYVRNDAAGDITASGISTMVNLPTCSGSRIGTSAFLASLDVFPEKVWDGVYFTSNEPFNLAYVEGSGKVYSNSKNSPITFPSNSFLTHQGQKLGFDALDGNLSSGYAQSLYVTFEVQAQFAP